MSNETEIEAKFWKALKSDRTVMLGLAGIDEDHSQPMTAQTDGDAVARSGSSAPRTPTW